MTRPAISADCSHSRLESTAPLFGGKVYTKRTVGVHIVDVEAEGSSFDAAWRCWDCGRYWEQRGSHFREVVEANL